MLNWIIVSFAQPLVFTSVGIRYVGLHLSYTVHSHIKVLITTSLSVT